MAEVGDIVGHLRIDTSAWQQGLRQAEQQLAQFAQQITRLTSQLNQFSTAFQQALTQNQQGLAALPQRAQQASQSFQQFNTQVNQTNQAFTVVNQTVQQFNTHLAATTNNVNNVRQGLQQAQGAASGFGSVWQGALSVAGGLGIVTSITGIVSGLKSLATEALQAASRMETLRAQFTALQGEARAGVTLQGLFTTAQRLGVEFGTLANAFRQFDAATQGTALEGAKAQRVFEQITTGMRAMGASSEQVGRALLALQQMVGKGVVSQEELRQQLSEALPGATNIAARAFGVTTQEMNKMIEKGMEATSFVQTFANQVEREFAGKATTATNTLASAWQRFSNELEQFKGSLAGGELVGQLRDLANWAAQFLATMRQTRELQQERMGGAAPVIPPEMAGMRTLEARQKEIEALRRTLEIGERGFAYPGEVSFFGGMPTEKQLEEARARLLELQKMQADAIKRIQDQWAEEGQAGQPLAVPGGRQADALRKIQDDLQKQLRDIDLTAAFVSPLELAEARLKAIEESFKRMREVVPQIGQGLRQTLIPTGKKTPFDDMIEASAAKYGQDPNVIRALIEQESGFRPGVVSSKGAEGLMQIMPGTAAQYGGAGKNLLDAATNIELGTKIFADLMRRFNGDLDKALTAYNAGPGRGGIPLPTGENATFARDVRRRIPSGPGDVLEQTARQRRAAELAVEAEKPDPESAARIRATGREQLRAIEEEERQADTDARERREQVRATGREYLRGLEQEIRQQDQAVEQLKRLASAYGTTKEMRDRDTASQLAAQYPQNETIQQTAKLVITLSEEAEATRESFNAIKQRTDALREASDAQDAFQAKLDQAEARLRAPKEEREETRLRLQAQTEGIALTPRQEEQLQRLTALRREQERLTQATEIWRDVSFSIGSAWSQALQSIADGTKTVSEAFRAMGQSILQTFADIAAQQATMAIFKLGVGILTGALTGGVGGEAAVGAGINPIMFQHGGVVRAPTMAMLGENPAHNPEVILNRQQMQSMFGSSGSGQQSQVSIHNYPSKAAAEQGAAQQRGQGHTAIVNAVLEELSVGESSRINRAMRALQR